MRPRAGFRSPCVTPASAAVRPSSLAWLPTGRCQNPVPVKSNQRTRARLCNRAGELPVRRPRRRRRARSVQLRPASEPGRGASSGTCRVGTGSQKAVEGCQPPFCTSYQRRPKAADSRRRARPRASGRGRSLSSASLTTSAPLWRPQVPLPAPYRQDPNRLYASAAGSMARRCSCTLRAPPLRIPAHPFLCAHTLFR